jgi:hypothetical protein
MPDGGDTWGVAMKSRIAFRWFLVIGATWLVGQCALDLSGRDVGASIWFLVSIAIFSIYVRIMDKELDQA